ncbi:hypothetical protein [Nocardia tengchongensis]|uniref:hypothetical protein n=1 Tax=Nocardia tengchongensis TaxID=2055889 RepID=UPI0036B3E742
MPYALDRLPDLSPYGGHWTTTTVPASHTLGDHPVERGLAHLPDVEWQYQPDNCEGPPWGDEYLDGTLELCPGCGIDVT